MLDFSSSGVRPREPILSIPIAVVVLVALLLGAHAAISSTSFATQDAIYLDWGFIPGRFTVSLWPDRLSELLERSNIDSHALDIARMWRATTSSHPGLKPWTLVSYAFLHGSWTHVGLNCIWIVAFGPPLARRFGPLRFYLFFAATAACGALLHWLVDMMDFTPLIGASAAASGFMAGAARFMFQPGAPLGPSPRGPSLQPGTRAASLREVLTDRRALFFIGIWLVTNVVFGAGARALGASDAPVAWIAHIGGFAGGLLLFPLFDGGFDLRRRPG
jgi:membrane associated rhomboid family serine protease